MPVRKLKNKYTSSVSGVKYSQKSESQIGFESTLERDFVYLSEFDHNVHFFEEQPVTIEYYDQEKQFRRYTPDFLVTYDRHLDIGKSFKPMLVEVKYREDLWKNWKDYKPKFQAAIKYAEQRGWRFKIMTEKEIRTDYLINAKFLLRYRHVPHDAGMIETLVDTMKELRLSNPQEIIKAASICQNRRAELLYTLWYVLDCKLIGCDLNSRLTMSSEIWSLDNPELKFVKP